MIGYQPVRFSFERKHSMTASAPHMILEDAVSVETPVKRPSNICRDFGTESNVQSYGGDTAARFTDADIDDFLADLL